MMPFRVEFECWACEHLDDTTRAVWRHAMFYNCCYITSEEEVALVKTLFTPETPEVYRGLKHITHLSIGIVVSR